MIAADVAPADDSTDASTPGPGAPSPRRSKPHERRRLGEILIASGALTEAQLEHALAQQATLQLPLGQTLIKLSYTTDEIMRQALSAQLGVPYIDLGHVIIDRTLGQWIDRDFARRHALLPIARVGRSLTVAMDDPTAASVVEELERLTKHGVTVVTSSAQAIQQALNRLYEKPAARAIASSPGRHEPEAPAPLAPDAPPAAEAPPWARHLRDAGPGSHPYAAVAGLMTFGFADLLRSIEGGLAYRAFDELVEQTGLAADRVAEFADIARRTLAKRKTEGRFSRDESDRLLRVARVFALAFEALGRNRDVTAAWLLSGQPALGGSVPVEVGRTELGAREVEAVISRLTQL